MKKIARTLLHLLRIRKPGELNELKHQLWMFVEE